MQFLDDSLLPKNQDKLVITVAPYGPEWMPEDFLEDIPVSMDEQVQKAVDCYNAGARRCSTCIAANRTVMVANAFQCSMK